MASALTNGNFSNPAIWDTGVVPGAGENVYANGSTIQVDGTYNVLAIRTDINSYYLPASAVPIMTSNTSPSGVVSASSFSGSQFPYLAFDNNIGTYWQSGTVNTGILQYQFPSAIIARRYAIYTFSNTNFAPSSWTFEGSNNGSSWTGLDMQIGLLLAGGTWTSYTFPNAIPYSYYRISITVTRSAVNTPYIVGFEISASVGTITTQVAGGSFNLLNGSNLTTTASAGIVMGSITTVLNSSLSFPDSATFNGSVLTSPDTNSWYPIRNTGSGTLNLVGNYSVIGGNTHSTILNSGTGVVNITGAVTSNNGSAGNPISTVANTSTGTISVTGPVNGGGSGINSNASSTIYSTAAGTVNVTGNVTAGLCPAITTIGGNVVVIGNVTSTATTITINNLTTVAVINVTGTVTAGSGANAISGLGLVRLSGIAINNNRFDAIYSPQVTIELLTTSWTFQNFAGATIALYASGASLGNPALGDVRFGTVYGPSGTLTGTLRVPNPNTVLLGALTDNTTGTLIMTPDGFIQELGVNTRAIALRLQSSSTVDTTGAQLSSYNI